MNEKRLKKYLKSYGEMLELADSYEKEAKKIGEKTRGAKAQVITGMPRGGSGKTMEEMLTEKADLEKSAREFKILAKEKREEIRTCINKVVSPKHNRLLRKHYIELKSVECIAVEEGYCDRQEWRIYKEAHEILAHELNKNH